ncbi:MAG TPA: pyridoxal-phosphate dependent enzyme [Arachnia sp.]|nr:pyridoxal-phosphate dependent enzyme [Arachnia sp.]
MTHQPTSLRAESSSQTSTAASAAPFPMDVAVGVGSTPLVPLTRIVARRDVRVLAKLESRNPTGSAKDRSALGIVRDAWERGLLRPGSVVVESSSGNLAVAMARLAALLGFSFECVVDPRVSERSVAAIQAYGARVHRVTVPDAETGDWLIARLTRVRDLLASIPGAITLDQYSNRAAPRAHAEGTMREILDAVGAPDRLYVATSTTGTLGGCLSVVESEGLSTRVVAVDALGSVLFGGTRGTRLLSGYGAGFVPPLAEGLHPAGVARIDDLTAVLTCRALARTEGLLVGPSTGAVVAAALADLGALPAGSTVVLLVHDGGMPYVDTVFDDAWICRTFSLSPEELSARIDSVGEAAPS